MYPEADFPEDSEPTGSDSSGGLESPGGPETGGLESEDAQFDRIQSASKQVREELARVIVGQDDVIDQLLLSLFAGGHCLLVGVPGLAKTLLISTVSKCSE